MAAFFADGLSSIQKYVVRKAPPNAMLLLRTISSVINFIKSATDLFHQLLPLVTSVFITNQIWKHSPGFGHYTGGDDHSVSSSHSSSQEKSHATVGISPQLPGQLYTYYISQLIQLNMMLS